MKIDEKNKKQIFSNIDLQDLTGNNNMAGNPVDTSCKL